MFEIQVTWGSLLIVSSGQPIGLTRRPTIAHGLPAGIIMLFSRLIGWGSLLIVLFWSAYWTYQAAFDCPRATRGHNHAVCFRLIGWGSLLIVLFWSVDWTYQASYDCPRAARGHNNVVSRLIGCGSLLIVRFWSFYFGLTRRPTTAHGLPAGIIMLFFRLIGLIGEGGPHVSWAHSFDRARVAS